MVPIETDPVENPVLIYDGPKATTIYFTTDDGLYGRVTFEGLDSIRVCRGEFCPLEQDRQVGSPHYWVLKVENSTWLNERYAYESKHYRNTYCFGRDVDEMLTDFSHYIFCFHDEFIEALALGVWFEKSESPFASQNLSTGHPFLPIATDHVERIEAHGLVCQVRKNPLEKAQLTEAARLCSQPLIEFAPELDGEATTSITLSLRCRNGNLISLLNNQLGRLIAEFNGVADIDDARPYVEAWMAEVYQRRKKMGK